MMILPFAFLPGLYNNSPMERAVNRIIDANLNRAREAIRVIEEFCRFSLNCSYLSEQSKQLRHQFCKVAAGLDILSLLCSRDTPGDVGIGREIPGQHTRENLFDCLVAACKRLTEALRVLAEYVQTENQSLSQQFEQLRYRSYILEKDIILYIKPAERFSKVRLYVLISGGEYQEILTLTGECAAGGADCIQLRAKHLDDKEMFALANDFVRLCKDTGVISVINDRIDIAVTAGADGVHLGQGDLPVECVSRLQLSPLVTGKSTHSIEQLQEAVAQRPTYVALGPVFPTDTKSDINTVGLDYIKESIKILENTGIGHVAIGGINAENIESVIAAGAKTVAVCSAVTQIENPAEECAKLKQKIADLSG